MIDVVVNNGYTTNTQVNMSNMAYRQQDGYRFLVVVPSQSWVGGLKVQTHEQKVRGKNVGGGRGETVWMVEKLSRYQYSTMSCL